MFITIIRNWEDGLISTSEALTQILSHPSATHGYMLDAIAELTLKLRDQEEKTHPYEPLDHEQIAYDEAGGDYVWADRDELQDTESGA